MFENRKKWEKFSIIDYFTHLPSNDLYFPKIFDNDPSKSNAQKWGELYQIKTLFSEYWYHNKSFVEYFDDRAFYNVSRNKYTHL